MYFQGKRLAKASGHSIQEAEMNSAKEALEKSQGQDTDLLVCNLNIIYIHIYIPILVNFPDLFPQLDHQKRVIAKSMKMQSWSQGGLKFRTIQSSKFDDTSEDRNIVRNEDRNPVRKEDRRHDDRNVGRSNCRDDKYEGRQRDNRHSSESDSDSHRKRRSRSRERAKRSSHSRERYDSVDRRLGDKPRSSSSCSSSNSSNSPVRNKSAEWHSSLDNSTSRCTENMVEAAAAQGDGDGEDKGLKGANRKRRRSSVSSSASSNDATSSNNIFETDKKCVLSFSEKKMKRLE